MAQAMAIKTLRDIALNAISETRKFVPAAGQNRSARHDRNATRIGCSQRQRAWGVPITVFVHKETNQVAPGPGFDKSTDLVARITDAIGDPRVLMLGSQMARKTASSMGIVDNPGRLGTGHRHSRCMV